MTGENNLAVLIGSMNPVLNNGEYVFCCINNENTVRELSTDVVAMIKEKEGITVVLEKRIAERYNLLFSFVASWITLTVHSSLEAVGLTAAFSNALANSNISCNVIAGYYHDHIFVDKKDAQKAIAVLTNLSQSLNTNK